MPGTGKAAHAGQTSGMQTVLLTSNWARVTFEIEPSYIEGYAEEVAKPEGVGRLPFRLNLTSGTPSQKTRDEDPDTVGVQLEMNSPQWITHQLDPSYPNHFHLYRISGKTLHGLELRPSGQMEIDGAFLLTDANRRFPVMIECYVRPDRLPTWCQLWQRRERGFTISIFFNGSRLADWASILGRVESFVAPRIKAIEGPRQILPPEAGRNH